MLVLTLRQALLVVVKEEQVVCILEYFIVYEIVDLSLEVSTLVLALSAVREIFLALTLLLGRLQTCLVGFFFEVRLLGKEMADSQLVSDDDVGDLDALFCLLVRIFVSVQLRVNGTQLQVQAALEFELVDARRDALVTQTGVLPVVHLLEARFEAKGALRQLAELLVAHRHVVEDLQGDKLIPAAPG